MQRMIKTLMITLLTAASATLSAAPVGYSINSDSTTSEPDSLYTIDLSTGNVIKNIGIVQTGALVDGRRLDVEGLAFAPDGTLYGIDDESLKLFRINPATALVDPNRDYQITGNVLTPQNNDFGMSFACDGTLYATSVSRSSLYRISLTGTNTAAATLVGSLGGGIKVGALAAIGSNPTRLYGLSNGALGVNAGAPPHVYEINPATGLATDLGQLGGTYAAFAEAGLGFDDAGVLWAITDRSPTQSSQVMQINLGTKPPTAEQVKLTPEQGFESLAVAPPVGCDVVVPGDFATFLVQKRFADGNNITPVTFNFSCTGGTVFNSSKTIFPEENGFGPYLVTFNVGNLPGGAAVECEITETPIAGYTPEYACESRNGCSTQNGADYCRFQSVEAGQTGTCEVLNQVDPVEITVTKEWLYTRPEIDVDDNAEISLYCSNVANGDGQSTGNVMRWTWDFTGSPANRVAVIYPEFGGGTRCWTEERLNSSAIESESTCSAPVSIAVGDSKRSCTVTNTVFFEGIPTLNPFGLALISALMLLTGLVSVRRIA
jgi:hypothetical protein